MPQRPPIAGLELAGVHLLHTVDDALSIADRLAAPGVRRAVIVGAGYIGLEMADALCHREARRDTGRAPARGDAHRRPRTSAPTSVPTLERHGVRVLVDTVPVSAPSRPPQYSLPRCGPPPLRPPKATLVLVLTGVTPDTEPRRAARHPHRSSRRGAVGGRRAHGHGRPGDAGRQASCRPYPPPACFSQPTYRPLGTTAHKQGRVAGENAVGGGAPLRRRPRAPRSSRSSTWPSPATGLRDETAPSDLYQPQTHEITVADRNRYYRAS